jgi:hypothetical protein
MNWNVMNEQDGNDFFPVEADTLQEAALLALEELGYRLQQPDTRTLRHTRIVLDVVSDRPVGDMPLSTVLEEAYRGDFVGGEREQRVEKRVPVEEASKLLSELGSDICFFGDDDENDGEDEGVLDDA